MTRPRWYARPTGQGVTLRRTPRLASWNKAGDPDQLRLTEYLDDTVGLLTSARVNRGPWALVLYVAIPHGRDLLNMADLDNYLYPLAARMRDERLVSVWCTKRHGTVSSALVAPAHETLAPEQRYTVRTTASAQTASYKEQVRSAVADASQLRPGPVQLQIAFVVGAQRNWMNLWKPTIDSLHPLLGRTRPDREWHPNDGRIIDLSLHVHVDSSLGHDVVASIAAEPASAETLQ